MLFRKIQDKLQSNSYISPSYPVYPCDIALATMLHVPDVLMNNP